MAKLNKFESDLYEKSLETQLELLGDTANILVISVHPEINAKLTYAGKSKANVFLLKQNSTSYENSTNSLYENDINSLDIGKFEIIILDDIFEYLTNPMIFLKNITKFLEKNGSIICSVYNFTNIINRIKILDGDFNNIVLDIDKKLNLFSLDNLLLLLSESDFSITNFIRIKKQLTRSNQADLKNYILPQELLDAISADFESDTFEYVFTIKPGSSVDPLTRRWIYEFSKNQVTEKLNSILDEIRKNYERKIEYHIQSNREQYAIIKHLEQGISDTTEFYVKHYEKIIKDKDAYTEQIIKDKDHQLNEIKSSMVFRVLRKFDRVLGRK